MKRLIRPLVFTTVSVGALVVFLMAERWSVDPLDWRDPGAWLERVDPVDALVEVARWLGMVLAAYVAVVSITALLAELSFVVRMPRLGRHLRRLAGAVAFPALRRRLVEVTTAVTITASSINASPALAGAPTPAAAAAVDSPVNGFVTAPIRGQFEGFEVMAAAPALVDADTGAATYIVQTGDTLWQILERHYGWADANLVRQVAAVSQVDDPNRIWPGMAVTLPAATDDVRSAPQGEATWSAVTVRPGDTLWGIVEHHYGAATSELVWAVVDANPEIADPGLILPGQVVTLPPLNGHTPEPAEPTVIDPTPPVDETPPPAPTVATATTAPPDTAPPTAPPTTAAVEPATGVDDVPVEASVPVAAAGTPTSIPPTSEPPAQSVEADDDFVFPPIATIVGWTGGAGLAAALLALAARRRRRLPIYERHARPPKRAVQLGIAMFETDNVSLAEWASLALRHLGSRLRPRPGEPTPVPRLLRLADDTVEIVWDSPHAPVIAPWTTDDGGWSWNIRRTVELEPSDAGAPCPAFVTIGRRDGADVLLNLESCGAVTLTGVDVRSVVRSIGTEAAAGVFGDAPTVLLVGAPPMPGDPECARVADADEAIGWLRNRADSAGALLAHRRLTSLFALRARSKPHDSHEPVVVIIDGQAAEAEDVDRIVGLANGDLGAVVLLLGEHPSVSWHLECSERDVTLHPLGLQLDSVRVAEELDELIDQYVPDADLTVDEFGENGFESDADSEPVLADYLDMIALRDLDAQFWEDEDGAPSWDAEDEAEPTSDVELRVLGQVTSVGSKDPLSPTELHLAIFLAFNRGGQNRDTIEAMLWPDGVASRTVTNAMAGLRRKLGIGSDGEQLFPFGRNAQHLYYLSDRVTTDWDRFRRLVRRADSVSSDEALPLLDEALSMVTGPPFRAKFGYSWAFSDGTVSLITETIKAAGERSAQLHTARNELTEAATALAVVMNVIGTDDSV